MIGSSSKNTDCFSGFDCSMHTIVYIPELQLVGLFKRPRFWTTLISICMIQLSYGSEFSLVSEKTLKECVQLVLLMHLKGYMTVRRMTHLTHFLPGPLRATFYLKHFTPGVCTASDLWRHFHNLAFVKLAFSRQ